MGEAEMQDHSIRQGDGAFLPEPVPLLGRHIQLVPLAIGHAREIYRLTHGDERDSFWEQMKVGPFADAEAFDAHVAELIADRSRTFLALETLSGTPLGWLCLMEAKPHHRVIELGYVIFAPTLQRTSAATEVFWLIMTHVFDELGYLRLEWTCTAENTRSRKAAERLGFVFEGTMRDKLVIKGQRRDICMYSMLARDWPKAAAGLAAWLSDSNFVQGRQLRSLEELRAGRPPYGYVAS
jgi:RimJ/RimL family protein N-acetyltransferase